MGGLVRRGGALKAQLSSLFEKRDSFFYLFLLAFAFQIALTLLQCRDLVDDAYISARYAHNLARGFGLVYNRGERLEPVEGYSNFLWVLLLALGIKMGLSPKLISQFLGVIFALTSSVLLFLWVRRESQNKWLGLLSVFFLGTNLYFAIWQVEGLEAPLFGLLLLSVLFALSLEKNLLAIFLTLLFALTRPEGILLFLVLASLQFFRHQKEPGRRKRVILSWLWFIIPYLTYFLWRALYYQSLFPNTFYAKTGLGIVGLREGGIYLGKFFLTNPSMVLLTVFIITGALWTKQLSFSLKISLAFVFIYFLFLFLVGGDWMPGSRLLVPLVPIFCGAGMILFGAEWLSGKNPKRDQILLYLVSALILFAQFFQIIRYEAFPSFEKTWHRNQGKFYLKTADWLLKYVWQGQPIALGDIGYIGYFGDHHRIIDTAGLVDRHLGRLPGISSLTTDLDYIFSQEPFAIVSLVHKYEGGAEIGHTEFDRQLVQDARLKMEYRLAEEIFGWDSEELSRVDWKKRKSKVYFKIYLRYSP